VFVVIRVSIQLKYNSNFRAMNSEAENPREHEPGKIENRNISIDEALSLFSSKLKSVIREERANFRNELEEQVTDIKRDLVLKRSANKELIFTIVST
jgi:hypothetical protein